MQDRTLLAFHIISAETKDNDRTLELLEDFKKDGIMSVEVEGCYKGVTERAFMVFSITDKIALEYLKKYEQESALYIDNERSAYLLYADGVCIPYGQLKSVTETRAKASSGYTKRNGSYFICD